MKNKKQTGKPVVTAEVTTATVSKPKQGNSKRAKQTAKPKQAPAAPTAKSKEFAKIKTVPAYKQIFRSIVKFFKWLFA